MTEEQIWDILDGNALPEVQKEHEYLLQTDAEYRVHFESYAHLHDQLCHLDLDAPSMRFEQNLMERLQPTVHKRRSNDYLPLFFFAFMSVLAALILYLLPNAAVTTTEPSLPVFDSMPTEGVISWLSNPAFFYGFILLNVVVFFAFLDRKVFKPFFAKKLKQ